MDFESTTDDLIYSYLRGSASEEELGYLLNWLKQCKENVSHFNHICAIWENSQNTSELEIETAIALRKLNDRIEIKRREEESEVKSVIVIKKSLLWKVAAIIIILIGLPTFFYIVPPKTNNHQISKYVTAIAPKSQKSQLILPDGTKVWLNSGTTLKYKTDYGLKTRDIYLNGEAYFEVAKNRSRPFLVHAATIMVKALGTSFNVKCYPEENTIETTLVEGKVQIYNDENSDRGSVLLKPNETAVYTKSDSKFLVSKIASTREQLELPGINQSEYLQSKTIASVISWKDSQLIFENESFKELSTRLERWYDVDIEVIDSTILVENSYTGKFVHNESLDQVLKIISRTTPISYTIIEGKVIIQSKDDK